MNFRKIFFILVMSVAFLATLSGAELTKVAVIDLGEIVRTFYQSAGGLKEVDKLKQQYKEHEEKILSQINVLKLEKAEAMAEEKKDQAKNANDEILKLYSELRAYNKTINNLIENITMKNRVNNQFEKKLQRVIQSVAIEKGFSIVIENNSDIIWFDRDDVDLTNAVIDQLRK